MECTGRRAQRENVELDTQHITRYDFIISISSVNRSAKDRRLYDAVALPL